jgi:hypothetical protein
MTAVSDVALTLSTAAPIAFALGLLVGFLLADRYRIVRRRD